MRRVTLLGGLVNIVLAVGKTGFGWLTQSQALVADGLHSFADLATDLLVLVAARHSNQAADQEHPYGHARIETASTVGLGLVLIAVAVGIVIDAGQRLLDPATLVTPAPLALLVALVSIIAKEFLYRYTLHVGRRIRSPLLRANAWHHRSDAVSSLVVLVGVGGALAGMPYLDAFAAVAVALMIGKIGWSQGWNALQELIDRGVEPEQLAEIETAIADVEGVRDLHTLRTRRMGGEVLVDVHVQVQPRLSVSEGHQIGEYVRTQLQHGFDAVSDVTVHVDPEDDRASERCVGLPLRRDVVRRLRERWQPWLEPEQILAIKLHYLSGKIDIELVLPLGLCDAAAGGSQLADRLRQTLAEMPELGALDVHFSDLHKKSANVSKTH